jgi:CBS domain-containing protein
MKVREIMSSPARRCSPETNLSTVGSMMWDRDCGIVPVVDHYGKVIGVLTDRDICMAVTTRGRLASEIATWEAASGQVATCKADDDVRDALKVMAARRVRRLPVVDENGLLQGLLSLTDVIRYAGERSTLRPSFEQAMDP